MAENHGDLPSMHVRPLTFAGSRHLCFLCLLFPNRLQSDPPYHLLTKCLGLLTHPDLVFRPA